VLHLQHLKAWQAGRDFLNALALALSEVPKTEVVAIRCDSQIIFKGRGEDKDPLV